MNKVFNKFNRLLKIHAKYIWYLLFFRKAFNNNDVTCIIFSRDRAMQLKTLLFSIEKFSVVDFPIIVQYSCSDAHIDSYADLEKSFSKVRFVREDSFNRTLIDLLRKLNSKYLFYMVDDQVFIRKFNVDDLISKMNNKTIGSLRLGANITNWGIQDIALHPIYSVDGKYIYWSWKDNKDAHDWGYQFSVDATIYRTLDVLRATMAVPFKAPNSYEANMNSLVIFKANKRGVAFVQPAAVNLIINASRTEDGYEECVAGEYSADDMLNLYNNGYDMDLDKICAISYNSTHHIIRDINSILK